MEKRYYLGLDGGGTKTACVLYDAVTGQLWTHTGGPTNHEVLPGDMADVPGALEGVLRPLLEKVGLRCGDVAAAVFGMSGVDTQAQHTQISGMIRAMGFGNFLLANDAYLAVKAVCGSCGVGAVNGTGCNVVGINERGRMTQTGGFGSFSGDVGGGDYLVSRVVRAVYEQYFKDGAETALSPMLFAYLGIENENELMETLTDRLAREKGETTLALCRMAYQAAAAGDREAGSILTRIGAGYAKTVRAVARRLELEAPVAVGLVGSQFTKCEDQTAIETLKRELGPGFEVRIIDTRPVAGALLWALELDGVETDGESLKKRIAAI